MDYSILGSILGVPYLRKLAYNVIMLEFPANSTHMFIPNGGSHHAFLIPAQRPQGPFAKPRA